MVTSSIGRASLNRASVWLRRVWLWGWIGSFGWLLFTGCIHRYHDQIITNKQSVQNQTGLADNKPIVQPTNEPTSNERETSIILFGFSRVTDWEIPKIKFKFSTSRRKVKQIDVDRVRVSVCRLVPTVVAMFALPTWLVTRFRWFCLNVSNVNGTKLELQCRASFTRSNGCQVGPHENTQTARQIETSPETAIQPSSVVATRPE